MALPLLAFAAVLILYPRIGAWGFRSKVLPKLEARLGRAVHVGHIDVSRGHAALRDVVIGGPGDPPNEPLLHIKRIHVRFAFWPSLRGKMTLREVSVEGFAGHARRRRDGTDNFSDLLRRFSSRGRGGGGRRLGLRPKLVTLIEGAFTFVDEAAGLRSKVGRISAVVQRGTPVQATLEEIETTTSFGPSSRVRTIIVTGEEGRLAEIAKLEIRGGEMSLWTGMALTGISGTVERAAEPGRLRVDLAGGYGGVRGKLWQAKGWVEPRQRLASIDLSAERFTFDRISPILTRSVVVDYDKTSVDATLALEVSGGQAALKGSVNISGLNLFHAKVAEETIRNIDLSGAIDVRFDRAARYLELRRSDFEFRGVRFSAAGHLGLVGGLDRLTGKRRRERVVGARLVIPKVGCSKMLAAIPTELVPYMQGFELRGQFRSDLATEIDWADLDSTTLTGAVGIRGCRVRKAPGIVDAKKLREPFTHRAEVSKGKWLAFHVGETNPDFVRIEDVSPFLIKSLLTTEDSRFYRHRGFIIHEFRSALIKNLKAGRFRYGASSITMQIVKNVMLYRSKLLSRKLQELFLTWYIESVLSKDRLMEIYVNVIEFGPGIYGIGPAARHYFGKHPRDLNPVEAVFFSSILPSPKKRHRQYCEGKLWSWTARKMRRYLQIMHKRDRLTDDEYALAQNTELVFAKDDSLSTRQCRAATKTALRKGEPWKLPEPMVQ